ncbi:dUTP diphosphatase [Candidatus Soleaferrea massiliensis]|uniref:dUTP diphosphatase n=1 Tax=Candidatus Soleaferrea massiliensis TaxID=1470354 RepID=UPI00058F7E3E|nr:dUTP diphosphatase [Candidatus Soleaferrea massiliensis]
MPKRTVLIRKLTGKAVLPVKATSGSAGYDLSAAIDEPVTIQPGEIRKISTGLAIQLPGDDLVAMIYARSGLSVKHGITLPNCVGVIDSDYRGELLVALINLSKEPYTIQPSERIAQLLVMPLAPVELMEAETLDETRRSEGGFGSTGR